MEVVLLFLADILAKILRSGVFWAVVLLLVLGYLAVLLYRRLKIRACEQLEYTRSISTDGVFAGDSFTLTETLHNPTGFPLFAVKISFFVPSGFTIDGKTCKKYTEMTSIFHVPPRASVRKVHTVTADLRGYRRMDTAALRYRDNEISFSAPVEIYTYPAYYGARVDMPAELHYVGENISSKRYIEDPFLLSGVRPYVRGDAMSRINFKASAHSFFGGERQLMSNFYDSSRNFNSMVVLDLFDYSAESTGRSPTKKKLERGLCFASFILSETVRQGGAVGFAANCAEDCGAYVNIPCGTGQLHVKKILEALACISEYARHDYSVNALLEVAADGLEWGTDIYLITSFTDEKTVGVINRLGARGLNVSVLYLNGGESEE